MSTQSPFSSHFSLKNHVGVCECQTRVCPLTGISLSAAKSKIGWAAPTFTLGFIYSPVFSDSSKVAFWSRQLSGFSSFPGVRLLKCFRTNFWVVFGDISATVVAVPTMKCFLYTYFNEAIFSSIFPSGAFFKVKSSIQKSFIPPVF